MQKLGYFLLALAIAILFIIYTHDANAEGEVRVKCFTSEQMQKMNDDMNAAVLKAYNYGHDDGMLMTFNKVRRTIKQFCANPDNAGKPVKFGQGVYLECPKTQQK